MKTNLYILGFLLFGITFAKAQAGATVYAKNADISENLDLKAVASIFGESSSLSDFERRLNEPKYQISNLDLNGDNRVDYLRVIESVENRTHVVIIQSVLDRDIYQDIATIELERDPYNRVSIQIVGNDYFYGPNFIYEPVFVSTPVIYASFWVTNYRPYYSSWSWNYYPSYFIPWRPYPIYRYRSNVNVCINAYNTYNYVNYRRNSNAVVLYNNRRSSGYERMHPNNSFQHRHVNIKNRYELDQRRVSYSSGRNSNQYQPQNQTNRNYSENRRNWDSRNQIQTNDWARNGSNRSDNDYRDHSQTSKITQNKDRRVYDPTNNGNERNNTSSQQNNAVNRARPDNQKGSWSQSNNTSDQNFYRRSENNTSGSQRFSQNQTARNTSPRVEMNRSNSDFQSGRRGERPSSNVQSNRGGEQNNGNPSLNRRT